ncbi:hypothetical protein B5V91_13780, partial [Heyndrickxia sporothermodurans]
VGLENNRVNLYWDVLGLCPKGLSLLFSQKEKKMGKPHLLLCRTLLGARVAPQHCPIPLAGKNIYFSIVKNMVTKSFTQNNLHNRKNQKKYLISG